MTDQEMSEGIVYHVKALLPQNSKSVVAGINAAIDEDNENPTLKTMADPDFDYYMDRDYSNLALKLDKVLLQEDIFGQVELTQMYANIRISRIVEPFYQNDMVITENLGSALENGNLEI